MEIMLRNNCSNTVWGKVEDEGILVFVINVIFIICIPAVIYPICNSNGFNSGSDSIILFSVSRIAWVSVVV